MAAQNIKILYTAALIEPFFERRKQEYLHSLEVLKKMNKVPYIVEPIKSSSFFDECGVPVFYSKTNIDMPGNKGVNEAIAMLAALQHYQFDDDDLIVKLTGRYSFTDRHFFAEIEREPHKDAYAKRGDSPVPLSGLDFFTGCFAMKYKYFKMFLNEIDFWKMMTFQSHIEWELGFFFENHPEVELHLMDTLHVWAHIFWDGYDYGPPKIY